MPRSLLEPVVFVLGLAVLCWVGVGYVGASSLALCVVLVIAACYVAGGLELHRYRQVTAALRQAVDEGLQAPIDLASWLATLPASLRPAVRQRIEGDRAPLPAPALTPYLVGLLVLLGMLGTLLGMTATLRGTGAALQAATDLDAMRASLAAPVKGLAFAFGTSIAGVAASAMLGLLSALSRRERATAIHALDAAIAGPLRLHTRSHQREQAFELLQRQVDTLPHLVEQLQASMATLVQQNQLAHERQLAQQASFHEQADARQARFAETVQGALSQSVADNARATRDVLQPVVASTADTLAQHAGALRTELLQATRQHLETVGGRLETSTASVTQLWADAIAVQRDANATLAQDLRDALGQVHTSFDQRAGGLVEAVASRFDEVLTRVDAGTAATAALWSDASTQQRDAHASLAQELQSSASRLHEGFEQRAQGLVDTVASRLDKVVAQLGTGTASMAGVLTEAVAQQRDAQAVLTQDLHTALQGFNTAFGQHATGLLDTLATRFDAAGDRATAAWRDAMTQQQALADALARQNRDALAGTTTALESLAASLVTHVRASNTELQASMQAQAQASSSLLDAAVTRLESAATQAATAWNDALSRQSEAADALARRNEQALELAAGAFEAQGATLLRTLQQSQAELQDTLATQMQAQAAQTLTEISRLVHDAAEAPKAAARVIAELRERLSENLARDNAMLEERGRLLATVETLLGAVNHASAEQREAVDALIATSADVLERVASRFGEHVQAHTERLEAGVDRIAAGGIEAASLGDVFTAALQGLGESNAQLVARLGALEDVLGQSLARSDEQLAYYVAQAREVVDLSVLAQKQIIGELQQLARRTAEAESA